ncbi:uncharacterized protein LOC120282984 [Dioscorea cayenensis subsp. rotundata]|uniref:Uncharacterized protein LOC120282984 n=1 Tax=Dioscorea cayennensis subsp. rotundata TaxID=55577 RepID=A0AB40D4N6_DIOCR|nr:uncharacterized protein LOC120282984 [Dioscorea cayenensis subsp. rotundata]
MNFPSKWISWVKSCITSASFSLLINKQPSGWFKSTRGLRQGDPLSSYLFILAAQNLTALLNFAMRQNMIPSFNSALRHNFNHLMYADDLILISLASRKIARNINLCLSIYESLTGQRANKSKSGVYFPSRFNLRLQTSISSILGFTVGKFPLTYLGLPISPRRLPISSFTNLLAKTENIVSSWKHSKISMSGKAVLINSVLMSNPVYYLSVYPVPDTILDGISKAARKFFWSKSGNRKGMNLVSWTDITLKQTEGGISIRNLRASKISLMAKNVISYLNHHDAIWVDILYRKYGNFNFWTDSTPANCSWFFRGLCHNANIIKPHLWLYHFNPAHIDLMLDPWYFEIPLAFKPTFLNMDFDLHLLSLSDLLLNDVWNYTVLHNIFGAFLNLDYLNINKCSINFAKHWVWFPKANNIKTTSMVYSHFNNSAGTMNPWDGWRNLWRLKIAPRPKYFMWLLLHNGIKTYDYLYRLNLGPQTLCRFCNIDFECTEHLFNHCSKAQYIWRLVSAAIGKQVSFLDGFSSGHWLSPTNSVYDLRDQSVIAVTSWLIWKSRCNLIFRNESPDFNAIHVNALSHVREFSLSPTYLSGSRLILNNFSLIDSPFLFVSSLGKGEARDYGAGFYLSNACSQIICAGCCNNLADSILEADALALLIALGSLHASDLSSCTIFIASNDLYHLIQSDAIHFAWRLRPLISSLSDYLSSLGHPRICIIPKAWLAIANSLALHGLNSHVLTLFHQGKDLPRWLMRQLLQSGVSL